MEPIDLLTTWHRTEGAVWRRTLDGVVVLPPSGREALALLGPAASMWELLAEPRTAGELVVALTDEYDVDADDVTPEIRATLDGLQRRGALCRR